MKCDYCKCPLPVINEHYRYWEISLNETEDFEEFYYHSTLENPPKRFCSRECLKKYVEGLK